MENEIAYIPKLPNEIVQASSENKLAIFIGAGVSRLVGCLGWDELGRKLIDRCFENEIISYREQQSLLQETNPKKLITIAKELLEENGQSDIFLEIMKSALRDDNLNTEERNVYDDIYGLRGLCITTNSDRLFHRKFQSQNIVYVHNEIRPDNVNQLNLYQIHGCILEPKSMIFTVRDYFVRYSDQEFKNFLGKIFDEYTVLFLGYGLGEFELLEYLFQKFDSAIKCELKRFILIPLFSGEERILSFEQKYYRQMGIKVLAYRRDEKGYHQLSNVLNQWNKELNRVSTYLYNSFEEIDRLIKVKDDNSEKELFQRILNDKSFEDYTFRKLTECENSSQWLISFKNRGYFDGIKNHPPKEVKEQPGFYTMPFWNVLTYLERVAKSNKENPSDDITNGLVEIVSSIICYKDNNGKRIENYRTDWFVIKIIFMLPYDKWNDQTIEFVDSAIRGSFGSTLIQSEINKSVLPALIEHKAIKLILRLLGIIVDFTKATGNTHRKTKPVMEGYWQRDALKKFEKPIAELCGAEAAKIGIDTIKRLSQVNEGEFSYVWISTIEDSKRNQFPDKYESQLVFFVRDMLESLKPEDAKGIAKELIAEKHYIFKRIAIHIINKHYSELNDLFWGWDGNPLNENECRSELYKLLEDNCASFDEAQIQQVLSWIESKNYNETDATYLAYRKKCWLSKLQSANNPDVNAKYKEYDEIAPGKVEHIDTFVTHQSGRARDTSPITPEELLKKTNEEIAEYLRQPLQERGWNEPSQEGLKDCLKQCIQKDPAKFTNDLKPFLAVLRIYQNAIIRGFSENKQSKDVCWKPVFQFIVDIIADSIFWNEKYDKDSYNYRDWTISTVADLIENGVNYEENIFGDGLLPEIEKTLLILVEKTDAKEPEEDRLIDHILNSPKGKVFAAIIHYCLCYSRLKKDEKIRWPKTIKEDFTRRLDRTIEPSVDYSVILGMYLAKILHFDREWVVNNIERIFPKDAPKHWKAGLSGYLTGSPYVYEPAYGLLRKNGHYAQAINTEFSDDYVQEKLVQHICVGFLENWEKLDDSKSLICLLLQKGMPQHLSAIVQFIGTIEDEESKKRIKEKIKPLWKRLYDFLVEKQKDKVYQAVISGFYRWLDIVDEIDDEITQWIKLTAKYINANHLDSMLVENLAKHVEKNPKNVGEIYIEMLQGGAYQDFDQKDIEKIVKRLYLSGEKKNADAICNMYGEVGLYFLRPIYENHNRH